MMRSRMMRSGRCALMRSSASWPLLAVSQAKPSAVSRTQSACSSSGSSSTTRTFGIRGSRFHRRLLLENFAHLRQQILKLERFGHVVVGSIVHPELPVLALPFRGDDDDRHLLGVRILFEQMVDLVAVHPRHDEIQENQVHPLALDLL